MKLDRFTCIMALAAISVTTAQAETKLSEEDRNFVLNTAQAGMTEVNLGVIARKKATNQESKSFAEQMIKDHTAANNKLKEIAEQKGMMVPTALNAEHQALVDKFNAMNKKEFDKAYAAQMVADHKKVADSLESQSGKGDDALQNFSKETLPTIKHHLKMAENMQANKGM